MLTVANDPIESGQPIDENLTLNSQEFRISKNVLKVVDVKVWAELSFESKQLEFRETCFAILSIVNNKLYRSISPSLEQYFKKRWCVSRAQVYRLYESAAVLKMIEQECTTVPFKERMCRQLKNCVGLNQEEIIKLWNMVLKITGSSEAKLASFNIEDYFTKTLDREAVRKAASQPKKSRLSNRKNNDNSDTDYSDTERIYIVPPKRLRSAAKTTNDLDASAFKQSESINLNPTFSDTASNVTISVPEHQKIKSRHKTNHSAPPALYQPKGAIDERLIFATGLERDFLQCQQSVHALFKMGYSLEALVHENEWRRPSLFKLNSVLDLDDLKNAATHIHIPDIQCKSAQSEIDVSNLNTLILAAECSLR